MITIDLGDLELYDEDNNEFIVEHGGVVEFEYSLKAVYDWEAMYKKPFLNNQHELHEWMTFYMLMANKPFDARLLTVDVMTRLSKYIDDPCTATTFADHSEGGSAKSSQKIHTAESLYAMMTSAGIPLEFENRNLNRLLTMLRVISNSNTPEKKMSKSDIMKQNKELNEKRRQASKTKG